MAVIDDLSDAKLQNIVDLNFASLFQRVGALINKLRPVTDAKLRERDAVNALLGNNSDIIDAVWNSGVVAADAILNPEE